MHILGLPTDIFNVYPASIKYKTYQARWQIGDIYVSGRSFLLHIVDIVQQIVQRHGPHLVLVGLGGLLQEKY